MLRLLCVVKKTHRLLNDEKSNETIEQVMFFWGKDIDKEKKLYKRKIISFAFY